MANKLLQRPLQAVNSPLHEIFLDACSLIPGDFMEFGVWKGESFRSIYYRGLQYGRRVHAVDTFSGMPKSPIPADNERYPAGIVDAGGTEAFRKKFPKAVIHEGLVPDILPGIEVGKISFAHLDIDQEFGTRPALDWIWSRMTNQGILIVHDFSIQMQVHASKAVKDWMIANDLNYIGVTDNTIFFRKGVS